MASDQNNSARAIAWSALFFSFIAMVMSGFALFQLYGDGRLIENVKILKTETQEIFHNVKSGLQDDETSALNWDRVRARMDRIETMIRSGDEKARYYIDVLQNDLGMLKEYTKDKSALALDEVIEGLADVRENIDTGQTEEATERLGDVREKVKEHDDAETESPEAESESAP